jgi:hypothetical protein
MTYTFFLIGIVGIGVQWGPLGTPATNRPIVSAPGDYDHGKIGGMIDRGKLMYICRFVHHKLHILPGREPGPPWWESSVQPLELQYGNVV